MADNNLRILIEAAINEGASIGNINTTLKQIQKKINSLDIKMSIDPKIAGQIAQAGKQIENVSQKIKKQTDLTDQFTSSAIKSTNSINQETKAILEATDSLRKWNLEKERTNKQGIITQQWGNDKNNNKKQVLLDSNSNRIETPYQVQSKNYLKDQADADKVANERYKAAAQRQAEYEKQKQQSAKEEEKLVREIADLRVRSEKEAANRIAEFEKNQQNAIKQAQREADQEAKQRAKEANDRQKAYSQEQKNNIKEEQRLIEAMYQGRIKAESEAARRAEQWDKAQVSAINAVSAAQNKASEQRQTKNQQINDWWLKALSQQEAKETRTIEAAQKKRQQYADWWLKSIKEREIAEERAATRAAQSYTAAWEKALVNKRKQDANTLNQLSTSAAKGNYQATNGVTDLGILNTINQKYADLQVHIQALKSSNAELTATQVNGIARQIQALNQLGQKQRESEALTRQQIKAEQDVNRIINTFGNKVDANRLRELSNQIRSLTVDSANFQAKAIRVNQEIKMIADNARAAATSTKSFGQTLQNAIRNMAMYAGAGSFFFGAIQAMQNMISTIIEVDSQLTQMKRVMDGATDFESTMNTSITLANEFGRSIQDVNENLIGFARMGFNEGDTAQLAQVTTLFQNISDLSSEEAINGITSALINFNIQAKDSMVIADSINEVDNQFAVTSQDIVNSMNKSAAAAKTFGVDMNELIGYTTAIGTATRESGNIVGNSLKTILSRITTLPKAETALSKVGVSIKDQAGNLRESSDILGELGGKWSSLSAEQQQNTAINVAGTYQLTRFLALMQNWQIALNATTTAQNSSGSAMRENEKYMESLQARIQQMKTAWDTLAISFGDTVISDVIILITDALTGLANTLDGAVNVSFKSFTNLFLS